MIDVNCICHYMLAFQSVFTDIRSCPQASYNAELLNVFRMHLKIFEINSKEIAKLKNAITSIENIETGLSDNLIQKLNVYDSQISLRDIDKLKNNIHILGNIITEMILLLQKKDYDRVSDFADAVHNFPEFLISDTWKAKSYWNIYIKPYNKKWNDKFIIEWLD